MSLKAETLKHNKEHRLAINKEIKSILGYIDDELIKAHESGKHEIDLTLPINFSIPYMSNKIAQRKIYYAVLVSLIDRKFIPKLILKKESTILNIRWLSDEEIEEISLQNALIAKYSEVNYSNLNLD